MFFSSKKLRNDDIESFRSKRYRYPDNKTPPLITLSIRGKMRHNFSQFPRLYPQGFRDPEEIRRIYLWSGYRGHKFVRWGIQGERRKKIRRVASRMEAKRWVFILDRYSAGASGYATASENHQGRTTLSTTSPRVLLPVIFPSFSVSLLCHLSLFLLSFSFRVNVLSSTCISDGVIPSYFFSWQLKWISIGLGCSFLSSRNLASIGIFGSGIDPWFASKIFHFVLSRVYYYP